MDTQNAQFRNIIGSSQKNSDTERTIIQIDSDILFCIYKMCSDQFNLLSIMTPRNCVDFVYKGLMYQSAEQAYQLCIAVPFYENRTTLSIS